MNPQVHVSGAGPTAFALTTALTRRGIGVRIVDEAGEFSAGSRGDGLRPRTLEVFDDLGVLDAVLVQGACRVDPLSAAPLWQALALAAGEDALSGRAVVAGSSRGAGRCGRVDGRELWGSGALDRESLPVGVVGARYG
ncbi:FAD-dependent monooxygenase [Nocardia anaemiae]|uniref:FAD-dependent monooxygenase n=1 Tax=Nocardia anaemiae TaxID=263910 RepID=UPI0009FD9963|nr:FAD-dependent monooxygenase [Nocardia anaemiae]